MARTETTRTIQEIDPDIKAATLPVLQDVGRLYREGALGRVADSTDVRQALLEQADLETKLAAGQQYGKSVEGARALDQEGLDSQARGAERYFNFLGAAPQSQTSTTTAPRSGGK